MCWERAERCPRVTVLVLAVSVEYRVSVSDWEVPAVDLTFYLYFV